MHYNGGGQVMDERAIKKKSSKQVTWRLIGAAGAIALMLVAVLAYAQFSRFTAQTPTTRSTVADDGNLKKTNTEQAISTVADKVSPSVVSIVTNVVTQSIFGSSEGQAAGTGIIVSKDGYILTNKHVIDGANKVEVFLSDGTSYENVTIVGTDPLNDVAYLKVDGVSDFSPATLGDSSTIRVGQEVVAIGNSLGQYQNTVTSGIVSGKGRPVSAGDETGSSTETLTDLIQTDAAINPGNSGGPLLNLSGQVIGINTAVAANAQGIGFAIPISSTKGTLKTVLAGKGVKRAYLGVRYVPLSPETAKQYNLSVRQGAYVIGNNSGAAVDASGPAAKAGVKEKDIIAKVNGLEVGPRGSVSSLIGEYAPGDTVSLTILRDGKTVTVDVTLAAYTGAA